MVGVSERTMARNDVAVKLDAQVAREAGMVAKARGIPLAQYISEVLRPIVRRDLESETGRILSGPSRRTIPTRKPKAGD